MDEGSFHFFSGNCTKPEEVGKANKGYGMTFKLFYWLTPARLLIYFKAKEKLKQRNGQ